MIIEEYLNYTKKWKNEYGEKTLVLMQIGSFFEVYGLGKDGKIFGSNIEDFSSICEMVMTPKKKQLYNGCKVMMAGFGLPQLEKYSSILKDNGYTVVVYAQDINNKTTRVLTEIISAGTYFSQETNELTNNIMCIWIDEIKKNKYMSSKIIIGVSCVNNITGKCSVNQFTKENFHNTTTYDDLERHVSVYSPSECIIVSNTTHNIDDIIDFIGIRDIKKHIINLTNNENDSKNLSDMYKFTKNSEKQTYQKQIINKFFPDITDETFIETFKEYTFALQSFVLLLDFIYQHSPGLTSRLSFPNIENHSNFLLLANHSSKQLNIISDKRHNGKLSSVSNFLNNCVTAMGKRGFYDIINNPITNINTLNDSYELTDYMIKNNKWNNCRDLLIGVKDVNKFNRKLVLQKTTPKDIFTIYNDFMTTLKVYNFLRKDKFIKKQITKNKFNNIGKICLNITNNIKENFNLKKIYKLNDITCDKLNNYLPEDIFIINEGVSEEIENLLEKCYKSEIKFKAIQTTISDMIKKYENKKNDTLFVKMHDTAKQEPKLIMTGRRGKIFEKCIEELKSKGENALKVIYEFNSKKYFFNITFEDLRVETYGKNNCCVAGNEVSSLSLDTQKCKDYLITEIVEFYNNFVKELSSLYNDLDNISNFISWCDINQNKCYIATTYKYCKPEIDDSALKSYIDFKEIRHPLIEHLQTNETYVTNDLIIGNGVDESKDSFDGLLLYGTNAVGKTSFIRSVGISVILAQCGLFVPCSSFKYKPYKKIFTRILGNDNLFKGLSTFAVEMSELRTIIKQCDESSLILGDELCSGTESESAKSIFITGVDWLYNKESTFLFATHFHEIVNYKELEILKDRVSLKHMTVIYDNKRDVLIYDRKLKDGPGDSTYGLEVCKSLNMPDEFLKKAHSIRMKYDQKTRNVLDMGKSHFNSKKIRGNCEMCGKEGTEVHHLKHQKNADSSNYIGTIHKNHVANLINICDECHDKIHEENKQHRKFKTTKGYEILEAK